MRAQEAETVLQEEQHLVAQILDLRKKESPYQGLQIHQKIELEHQDLDHDIHCWEIQEVQSRSGIQKDQCSQENQDYPQ